MRIIVITSPDFIAGEVSLINALFDGGIDRIHIRKPQASADEVRRLIDGIGSKWHKRLSLHDHHHLAIEYGCGIHLNGRNPYPPEDAKKDTLISASSHSVGEVEKRKTQCDYVFMSPIFDSISKQGYSAAYSQDELKEASAKGIIDKNVIALGGVIPNHIPYLEKMGFGGAAFLGHVWQHAREGLFDCSLDTIFNGYVKPEH